MTKKTVYYILHKVKMHDLIKEIKMEQIDQNITLADTYRILTAARRLYLAWRDIQNNKISAPSYSEIYYDTPSEAKDLCDYIIKTNDWKDRKGYNSITSAQAQAYVTYCDPYNIEWDSKMNDWVEPEKTVNYDDLTLDACFVKASQNDKIIYIDEVNLDHGDLEEDAKDYSYESVDKTYSFDVSKLSKISFR